MEPTRSELDALLAAPRLSTIPGKELPWWWCDALFMGPPVWARMYAATGDRKYISYLDEEWWKTSDLLYDTREHLYARDASYLTKTEANGQRMFWGRGNGWVMGGIARTLEYLPKDDPARPKYVKQLQEMSARIASLQGKDGMWRSGLLDQDNYALTRDVGLRFDDLRDGVGRQSGDSGQEGLSACDCEGLGRDAASCVCRWTAGLHPADGSRAGSIQSECKLYLWRGRLPAGGKRNSTNGR